MEAATSVFVIERHGRTCLGSTHADLQRWTLDLDKNTAECEPAGYRQVLPTARRISIQRLAGEVAGRVVRGEADDRVHRSDDGSVHVVLNRFFPKGSGYKQTVDSRRKRLHKAVEGRLEKHGWRSEDRGRFRPIVDKDKV